METALTQLLRILPKGTISDVDAFMFLKLEREQIIEAINKINENETKETGQEYYKKVFGEG